MPSLSITQQHIARAAGAHNGVVGEESGEVCVCVFREGSGGWGLCEVVVVTEGKLEEAILAGKC